MPSDFNVTNTELQRRKLKAIELNIVNSINQLEARLRNTREKLSELNRSSEK